MISKQTISGGICFLSLYLIKTNYILPGALSFIGAILILYAPKKFKTREAPHKV